MKSQVHKSHYEFSKYIDKDRFMSYYYQLKIINDLHPESILEVGSGVGIIKKLIPDDIKFVDVDIHNELFPNIIANIENLPFNNNSFEMVCCFQVLEHLSFDKFPYLLDELKRTSKKYVLISLPYANHKFMFDFYAPKIGEHTLNILIPKFYRNHSFDGQHYWEVGKKRFSRKKVLNIIKSKFKILSTFTPKENSYHIFYLLEK